MLATEQPERSVEIRRRIFGIERLAAMPQVVWQLVDALGDERTTPARLECLIDSDQALAAKVLSLANSAYYGVSQKVTTVSRAVVVIGFQELELLALGAGLAEIFDLKKVPPGFNGEELWIHCLAVSWMARELAGSAKYPVPGEIMVAGLLHDLGKLVLATHLTDEFARVLELTARGRPYCEAEEACGLKHTTVGYWLAARWGLPQVHVSVIRDHHAPKETDPYFVPTSLVFLADHLIKFLQFGLVHEAKPADHGPALEAARLTRAEIRELTEKARKRIPIMLNTWKEILT